MLGTPRFHNKQVHVVYPDGFLKFVRTDKELHLVARKKGETIPLVSGVAWKINKVCYFYILGLCQR